MRKYLIFILLSCLHLAARGQTIIEELDLSGLPQPTQAKALRYWFDDDAASVQTVNGLSGHYALDVSGLIEGLHALHYQVIDTEDGVAYVSSNVFLKVGHSNGTLAVKTMRYWFDDDVSSVQTANGTTGTYVLDASQLIEGLHTLHYQLIDKTNVTAYIGSGIFLKVDNKTASTQAKALRYWFDDDAASVKTVASGGVHTLDVSSLLDGLHTIHYQVTGTDNKAYYVASGLFLKTGANTGSETLTANKLMYWFDDETTVQYVDVTGGAQLLDASGLIEGLHTLHYQVLCNNGQMTPATSSIFLRLTVDAETAVAKSLHYWFDDEQKATEVNITEGVQLLDASQLIEGLHTVHYQIANSNGTLGAPASSIFLKMNWDTASTTAKSLRYWFDDETTVTETAIANGTQTLEAARLIEGLHTVHYQIVDSNGTLGAPASSVFLKMDYDNAAVTPKSIRYWFDDDASTVKVTDVANGTQTLDVSGLLTGLHTLNYQLIDSNDRVSVPVTGIFLKNFDKVFADGKNRITKYQYWLNMNSQAMQTVELPSAANPYQLISLLPMQKESIHTECFQFEVTNNVPTIYAKNILHVRFYDAQNYFTDGEKPFVDYSVKSVVNPVGVIQSTQTFDRVAENNIRWYTLQAEEGDTLAFRLSQAATIQLFAPSGAEVYSAQGSTSVAWGGCHAWEDGTYYLAVHDVTGSQNRMTLDYMHMDKYDVVDWDVHTVGNGGCSTITFNGNGYKDLYAVDLYTANGDTIHSIDIGHESDATTSVTFDFTDATLGKYHAIFHFAGEDKRFSNILTVEEAVDIELATNVTFPSTFLRGTSTTYTIKITNKGNMTAYNVPLSMHISSNTTDGISRIGISGLDLKNLYEYLADKDEIPISELRHIKDMCNQVGEEHYFVKVRSFDNEINDSITIRSANFFVNLPPSFTKTITINIKAVETVDLWVGVPNFLNNSFHINESRRRGPIDSFCCYHEKIECIADATSATADFLALLIAAGAFETGGTSLIPAAAVELAGCVSSAIGSASSFTATLACDRDKSIKDKLFSFNGAANTISAIGAMLSCGAIKKYKLAADVIVNLGRGITVPSSIMNCSSAFKKKPGCPPKPPGGGTSNPVNSIDPNDIYGYTSESGSKFITDSIQTVNYTIEFENDTTFATASAHTVVVKDTLDSKYFDLASYTPTGIKIGEKMEYLDGSQDFIKTIDMRPEIYAIAQVEGKYDSKKGIATWTFTSLDPMTMEPTDDVMSGFLPVNYNGTSGIGEVFFDVNLKQKFANGTQIPNRASIVFDGNEVILTPTWTNTIDAIAPSSSITACEIKNDTTVTLHLAGTDNLSGVWKYDVYVQYGEGASWYKYATGVADSVCDVRIYEGVNHGFYVIATDSAGNAEVKEAGREYTLDLFGPTEDSDLELELAAGWNWISHNLNENVAATKVEAYAQRILGQEEETIKDDVLGFIGDLTELKPTLGYKIQMQQAADIALQGKLFNASYKSISLNEGWNWIGYPLAHEMELAQALEHFTPGSGDYIVGQDGFAQYADGQWTGTLATLVPGQGYLYKSGTAKQMFFNATATLSSRVEGKRRAASEQNPWTCDKHKYPNVMPVIASLYLGNTAEDAADYHVAAFCGNECRGVGKAVNGYVMMNVYGESGEAITFKAIAKDSELLLDVAESVNFTADAVGTLDAPYHMTIGGDANSIAEIASGQMKISPAVIRDKMTVTLGTTHSLRLTIANANGQTVGSWKKLADGSTVDVSGLPAGVYVVTAKAGKQVFTKKVMKVLTSE